MLEVVFMNENDLENQFKYLETVRENSTNQAHLAAA